MRRMTLWTAMLCLVSASALAQTLTVTAPNGGEGWVAGSTHAITWTGTELAGRNVDIVLRWNNTRVGDIALQVPADAMSFPWTVGNYQGGQAPARAGYQVLIRIGAAVVDQSDASFAILPAAPTPLPTPTPGGIVHKVPTQPVVPLALPDLVVCLRPKNYIKVPGQGYVQVKVKNAGQASIAGSRLYFRLSDRGVNYYNVPALAPGQVHMVNRREYYSLPGTETITARISRHVGSLESNVNNNQMDATLRKEYGFGLEEPFVCTDGSAAP